MNDIMAKIDQAVKGFIAAALMGSFVWCFNISSDVKINTNDIKHITTAQAEHTKALRELTRAVVELRVYLGGKDK